MKSLSIDQKIAIGVLIVAVLWLIIGPALLVLPSTFFDFRETGQIGDTIGGITAPIVGLASAILIYLSFSAQIKANKITLEATQVSQQEGNFKYIIEEFEKVKKSFKQISYSPVDNQFVSVPPYKGHTAMLSLTEEVEANPNLVDSEGKFLSEVLFKLEFTFTGYSVFISEVNSLNLSAEQKKIIQTKIWLYHEENINGYFGRIRAWQFQMPKIGDFGKIREQKLVKAFILKALILTIESDISKYRNSIKDK